MYWFFDVLTIDGLEFCRIAYDLFEYVKEHDRDGYELSKRPRNIKELIEEILPISVYVRTKYRLGNYIQVRKSQLKIRFSN